MIEGLSRMLSGGGDVARQLAIWSASEGKTEANIDPLERIAFEELSRVAELHVTEFTGLALSGTGQPAVARPFTRAQWAERAVADHNWLFERLGTALATTQAPETPDEDNPDMADPFALLMGGVSKMLEPALIGMQAGMMCGYLAQQSIGDHSVPLPRPARGELGIVSPNVTTFASDWSLPIDDVRLWVCISELAHFAVMRIPHVDHRLRNLLEAYVGAFRLQSSTLDERFSMLDPSDPQSLQDALGDPDALLGALAGPEQANIAIQLNAVLTAIEGYVDYVVDAVGTKLIASFSPLNEALRRRRVEQGRGDRFMARLLGIDLNQAQFDRATAFTTGVVERAGFEALNRIWETELSLPTPNEIEAPGLWLARIEYQ